MKEMAVIGILSFAIPTVAGIHAVQERIGNEVSASPVTIMASAKKSEGTAIIKNGKVIVTKETCNYLARHIPGDDVKYQPGIDAYGRPVLAADIEPQNYVALPANVNFYVREDFSGQANREMLADLAQVTVDTDTGEVLINGKNLNRDHQSSLMAECQSGS